MRRCVVFLCVAAGVLTQASRGEVSTPPPADDTNEAADTPSLLFGGPYTPAGLGEFSLHSYLSGIEKAANEPATCTDCVTLDTTHDPGRKGQQTVTEVTDNKVPPLRPPLVHQGDKATYEVQITVSAAGELTYSVHETDGDGRRGNQLLREAALGITVDGVDLGQDVHITSVARQPIEYRYRTRGKHNEAYNHGNEYTVTVKNKQASTDFLVTFRLYDEGMAFRYSLADGQRKHNKSVQINGDSSSFAVPRDGIVWHFYRDLNYSREAKKKKNFNYSGPWQSHPVSKAGKSMPVYGPPILIDTADGKWGSDEHYKYLLITEAALYKFTGMRLEPEPDGVFRADLTEKHLDVPASFKTPWRVVAMARNLDELVNTDIMTHLNPPPDPRLFAFRYGDVQAGAADGRKRRAVYYPSWIKPGRSVWSWWTKETGTPKQEREFVDYAVKLGYEYTTLDVGWERWYADDAMFPKPKKPSKAYPHKDPREALAPVLLPLPEATGNREDSRPTAQHKFDFERRTKARWPLLRDFCEYANDKGVKVIVWKMADELAIPGKDGSYSRMDNFFDKVTQHGASGVKIDFVSRETLDRVEFETATFILAAKHHLMISFHGVHKPHGEARRFPHEVGREAVWGNEIEKFVKHNGADVDHIPASHNAALPFTRFVVGPGDYTPLVLRPDARGQTTAVHQIGTMVLLDSPIMTVAEHPEVILDDKRPHARAVDLIKAIPTTWDQTHALRQSRIGQLAVLARRNGGTWWLAALSGLNEEQTVESIDTSFLEQGRVYRAVIVGTKWAEGKGEELYRREEEWSKGKGLTNVRLLRGDGLVARFVPR
ncbi:unnamed protein product [Vitrella brassicaformis CCMP3155]|uniref:Alpha-glucosidase n=1 Tax=Vitrella brassicaformis (strain CCMP3155) TaxID=1169540 RepID=A0A0G4EM47_VITBC|nr:unnamed protein product [Vitrella brassicaformis CCMP3155]|eukprot:CEL98223.1 unnamed protein product [Vitrella brassicaformis CCMP3155]